MKSFVTSWEGIFSLYRVKPDYGTTFEVDIPGHVVEDFEEVSKKFWEMQEYLGDLFDDEAEMAMKGKEGK